MEKEEMKQKSREMVKKLTDKFDKLDWKKLPGTDNYNLSFEGSGSITLGLDLLLVYNKDGIRIIEITKPTAEEGDAYNIAVLFSKVSGKYRAIADAHLELLMKELDKL